MPARPAPTMRWFAVPVTIRPYIQSDAATLSRIYRDAVIRIGARDYSEAQVEAWAALTPTAERLDELSKDGRNRFVAVDETSGVPLAFCDLEADGHIHFLYCAPAAAGRGVTAALYDVVERQARRQGCARLFSEASEAARRFFVKRGFLVTARRDFLVSGVSIHNYAVEKNLSGDSTDL